MRLPGTINTKRCRNQARCSVLELSERRFSLSDFEAYLPRPQALRPRTPTRCVPNADLITRLAVDV